MQDLILRHLTYPLFLPRLDLNASNGLAAAGFSHVDVIDTGSDLNAYANVEGQSGCCSPSMNADECCEQPEDGSQCCDKPELVSLPLVSCCSSEVHDRLADLLSRYDVNDYAASVKVYAVRA